jgi:hypothetical protein
MRLAACSEFSFFGENAAMGAFQVQHDYLSHSICIADSACKYMGTENLIR